MEYSSVVINYRTEQKQSLRDFASGLSEKLPESISHQTVANWENGSLPSIYLLLSIALTYNDWRRDFALDGLAAIKPELYASDPHSV